MYCGEVDGVKRYLYERWDVDVTEYLCGWGGHVQPSRKVVLL